MISRYVSRQSAMLRFLNLLTRLGVSSAGRVKYVDVLELVSTVDEQLVSI
jgi:hypothetical protein